MASDLILVVDDSPTEQRIVAAALQGKYRFVTAADGEEAIEKATKELPRLVILDVVMPKKNGYQVCRHLKTTQETKDIRVIMLTTKDQEVDKFWGMKQGADAYLTKPFSTEELLATIGRLY